MAFFFLLVACVIEHSLEYRDNLRSKRRRTELVFFFDRGTRIFFPPKNWNTHVIFAFFLSIHFQFIWQLDSQPIIEVSSLARYAISQYVDISGDVISHLNITHVRPEDGGLYKCKASNSMGSTEYSNRLNVYGEWKEIIIIFVLSFSHFFPIHRLFLLIASNTRLSLLRCVIGRRCIFLKHHYQIHPYIFFFILA